MNPFGISRDGVILTKARLKNSINTGIEFGEVAGCINESHVIDACNKANYRYYHDWQELDADQQAKIVAAYFANIAVQNHQHDAEIIASEKKK